MKLVLTSAIMGLFGAIAVAVSFSLAWPTWVMFIAYVSYYVFGRDWRKSLSALLQIELGILMGIGIQLLGSWLGSHMGALGFPLAVFFFIGLLPVIALYKALGNIPAWFLGLIIFFGMHPDTNDLPFLHLTVPVVAGFVFAWLNDWSVKRVAGH
jgi:hypothetical protein